ncbi:MAG: hypothetical protein Q9160_008861 [Pyrenula sp. 1 TL-2023]
MQLTASQLLASAALYGSAMAHFNFEALIVNGAATQPYEYVRRVTNSNSPVTSVDDPNIRCNVGGTNGTWSNTKTQAVNAGDKIGFTINSEIGHPGPVNVYLSQNSGSGDLSAYDGAGDWFKIYEEGADANSAGLQWFAAGATTVEFTIPHETPAGDYLVRGDHIALHGAGTEGGAQFYMGCAQITVSSSSTTSPPAASLLKFPGAYTATEPGIMLNIYYPPPQNYTMPGGSPWPNDSTSVVGNATLYADGTPAGPGSGSNSNSTTTSSVTAPSSTPSGVFPPSASGTPPLPTAPIPSLSLSSTAAAAFVTGSPVLNPAPSSSSSSSSSPSNTTTTSSSCPSSPALASSLSSLISALPSSVAAAPAPTVTAATGSRGAGGGVSTAGMSVKQLLELLGEVLEGLIGGGGAGGVGGEAGVKRRGHAREF